MARRPSGARFDQPKSRSRTALRPQYDPELFGRASERVARFIGSARFIGWMTAFVVTWLLWNILAPEDLRFDSYPFIFLTLMLSLQASYAAPLILLAQNRQADRDRVQFQEDRNLTERLVSDTEYLTREIASIRISTGDLATRDFLRGEMRGLAEELSTLLAQESAGSGAPGAGTPGGGTSGTSGTSGTAPGTSGTRAGASDPATPPAVSPTDSPAAPPAPGAGPRAGDERDQTD